MLNFDTMKNFDEIRNKYCSFWCLDFALVDCICMEDVWHANLTCRGHPHVPGNISSLNLLYMYFPPISEESNYCFRCIKATNHCIQNFCCLVLGVLDFHITKWVASVQKGGRKTFNNSYPNVRTGHKGQLAPRCRALDAMIKKFYHGSLGSKTLNNTSSLGLGGTKI